MCESHDCVRVTRLCVSHMSEFFSELTDFVFVLKDSLYSLLESVRSLVTVALKN